MELKTMRIYLVRHGETEWNRTRRFQGRSNLPLNQEGKKQVRALALALKNEPLIAIYTSPLIRAFETARLIKAFHPSTPIFEEKGLIEMDLGKFDGTKVQDWAVQYPDIRMHGMKIRPSSKCRMVKVSRKFKLGQKRHWSVLHESIPPIPQY